MSAPNHNQQVARVPVGYQAAESYLMREDILDRLGKRVRRGVDARAMASQLLSLLLMDRTGPALLECTFQSLAVGIVRAGELGLELAGPLGHTYLIPRKNKQLGVKEATFQLGYRGLLTLAWRSGVVRSLAPRAVFPEDHFDIAYGTSPKLEHRPAGNPGEVPPTHYYSVVQTTNGGSDFEVMTHKEMVAHRERYAADRRPDSVWNTNFDAMAKKTVLRLLCKRLTLCPDAMAAAVADEYREAGIEPDPLVLPAARSRTEDVLDMLAPPPTTSAGEGPPGEAGG